LELEMSRVFVAGSINMDVVATAERHPRIGETVAGTSVRYFPGGKGANQAVAASKLGAPTTLIGRLGKDDFGRELKAFLDAQDIDLSYLQEVAEAHTGTALITVADADNTIVVVPGANAQVSAADIAAPVLTKGDIAVSQFEIPVPTIHAFFERARACGATTILNPAPAREVSRDLLDLVDILILNESELGLLAKTDLCDTDDDVRIIEAIRSLQPRSDQIICVTLGRRGIVALIDGRPHTDIGRAVKAVDTTGAGDCFVGAVAALLADGQPVRSAFGYANIAASICVERMGAAPSMPTAEEVRQILSARRPAERRDDERN
jgi:ribokinase